MSKATKPRCQREEGLALITSVMILLVVTVIGLRVVQLGITEEVISGNFRSAEEAFYAADGGFNWIRTAFNYFNGTTQTFPTGGDVVPVSASGSIQTDGAGPPPVGKGLSSVYFGSQYYRITSVGTGPHNTQSRVGARVSQVTPK